MAARFSLDDFGAGLSSFAYLKNFNVDVLKIDGGFIRDITDNRISESMVAAITQVAKVMEVENRGRVCRKQCRPSRLIKELGVDYAQGHAVGKPVDHSTDVLDGTDANKAQVILSPDSSTLVVLTHSVDLSRSMDRDHRGNDILRRFCGATTPATFTAMYRVVSSALVTICSLIPRPVIRVPEAVTRRSGVNAQSNCSRLVASSEYREPTYTGSAQWDVVLPASLTEANGRRCGPSPLDDVEPSLADVTDSDKEKSGLRQRRNRGLLTHPVAGSRRYR